MKPFLGHPQRFLLIILAVMAVAIISTVGYFRQSDRQSAYRYTPANGDTINVAIHYSPMSIYRYGDTLGGLNYEIIKCISREFGDNFKFYPISSASEGIDKLEEGYYDLLIADIPMTAALKKRCISTVPVYTDQLVLVSRDTIVNNPLELGGKEVWVVDGTPAAERLENLSREIGDSICIKTSSDYTAEQLVILTANGKIPRAVVNEEVAKKLQQDYPQIRLSTHISFSQFQSWLLNKDDHELAEKLDRQIEQFKQTAQYDSILNKWTE